MNQADFEAYVSELPKVQREDNFGYAFFFVGDDHQVAFVTIGYADNEFDDVSNLNREGIFRLNIGVSKATFKQLISDAESEEEIDYSVLNVFLPHPHYARQNYICILNPVGKNVALTKQLIEEAHSIAAARFQRKAKKLHWTQDETSRDRLVCWRWV